MKNIIAGIIDNKALVGATQALPIFFVACNDVLHPVLSYYTGLGVLLSNSWYFPIVITVFFLLFLTVGLFSKTRNEKKIFSINSSDIRKFVVYPIALSLSLLIFTKSTEATANGTGIANYYSTDLRDAVVSTLPEDKEKDLRAFFNRVDSNCAESTAIGRRGELTTESAFEYYYSGNEELKQKAKTNISNNKELARNFTSRAIQENAITSDDFKWLDQLGILDLPPTGQLAAVDYHIGIYSDTKLRRLFSLKVIRDFLYSDTFGIHQKALDSGVIQKNWNPGNKSLYKALHKVYLLNESCLFVNQIKFSDEETNNISLLKPFCNKVKSKLLEDDLPFSGINPAYLKALGFDNLEKPSLKEGEASLELLIKSTSELKQ